MRVVLKVLVAARHCVDTTVSEPAHDQQRLSLDGARPAPAPSFPSTAGRMSVPQCVNRMGGPLELRSR